MKKITFWQRLNIALALMVLLLLGGFYVVHWTQKALSDSKLRIAELNTAKAKVRLDLVEADDAIRGFLLDPKSELEKERWRQASSDLKASIDHAESAGNGYTNLVEASVRLREFALKKLGPFQNHVLELAATNAPEAGAFYGQGYAEIRDQREKLFSELAHQTDKVKEDENASAERIVIVGMGVVTALIIFSIWLGFLHSTAVKK